MKSSWENYYTNHYYETKHSLNLILDVVNATSLLFALENNYD